MVTKAQDVRPSALAGRWYARDGRTLASNVDQFLLAANEDAPATGNVAGAIVPHAGHAYSGAVAAHAFARLRERAIRRVVVVGPSHDEHPADLLTTGHDAWATPLGVVPVDRNGIAALGGLLKEKFGLSLVEVRHDTEHSVEIELPFLQRVLGEFRMVPVMMVDQSRRVVRALAEALAETFADDATVPIASSDLSHFYHQRQANEFDRWILDRVAAFDADGVLDADDQGIGFACGRGAIAAVLWMARAHGANRVRVLNYATSGDRTGDFSSVVGYGAAEILKT